MVDYRYDTAIANRLISDLMRDFGLSQEQAIGFTGALAMESHGFDDLSEWGSGTGEGYGMWTGSRREKFRAFAEAAGVPTSSYEANYGFLANELQNAPRDNGGVLRKLKAATTPEEATEVVTNAYLRPSKPRMSARKEWTAQVAQGYAPTPGTDIPGAALAAIDGVSPVPGLGALASGTAPQVPTKPAGPVPPEDIPNAFGYEPETVTLGYSTTGTRRLPIKNELADQLRMGVFAVYGPGYGVDVMSAGQPEGPKGTAGTVGSRRHGTKAAADVWITDPTGKRLSGDALLPLAQHWLANDIGSVGFPAKSSSSLHLDLVGGNVPGAVPRKSGEGALWFYGTPTKSQRSALTSPQAPNYTIPLKEAAGFLAPRPRTLSPNLAALRGDPLAAIEAVTGTAPAGPAVPVLGLAAGAQPTIQVPPLAGGAGNDALQAGPGLDRLVRQVMAPTVPKVPPAGPVPPPGQSPTNWPALYAQFGIDAAPLAAPGKTSRARVPAPQPGPAPGKQDRARPTPEPVALAAQAGKQARSRVPTQPIVVPPRPAATVDPALLAAQVPAAFTRPNRGDPAGTAVVQPARLGDSGQFRNTGKPTIGDPNMVTMPPPKPATAAPAPAGPTILADDDPLDVALRTRAERVRNQKPELATNLNYRPGDMMSPDATTAAKGFDLDTTLKNRAEKAKVGKDKNVSRGTSPKPTPAQMAAMDAVTTARKPGDIIIVPNTNPPGTPNQTVPKSRAQQILDETRTVNPIVVPKKITVPPITPLPNVLPPQNPWEFSWGTKGATPTKKTASTRRDASQDPYTRHKAGDPTPIKEAIKQINSPAVQAVGAANEGMNPLLHALMSLFVPEGELMQTLTEQGLMGPNGRPQGQVSTALDVRVPTIRYATSQGPQTLSNATAQQVAAHGNAHGGSMGYMMSGGGETQSQPTRPGLRH